MNGRTFGFLAFALSLGISGCVTTQNQKAGEVSVPAGLNKPDEPISLRNIDGPKRNPKASTEIAYGKLKEADAESEAAKQSPESQGRLRDEARKAYQSALKADPNHLEALRLLASIYVKSNDFEHAFDTYKKAMAKHPKESVLWYDIALASTPWDFPESVRCLNGRSRTGHRDYLKAGFTSPGWAS